jgi:hypothetical protein
VCVPYDLHPSPVLRELFREKPYQGAPPDEAQFVFIGLDANYAANLDHTRFFEDVREYHADGVAFWGRRGVHHPFLLDGYKGAGLKYHRYFAAKLGFTQRHARLVSFTEMLHLPTTSSRLAPEDLEAAHLQRLNSLMADGRPRHIFVCSAVADLMRSRTDVFDRIPSRPRLGNAGLYELRKVGPTTVYEHVHFSAWGSCEQRKQREAAAIRALVEAIT